MKYREPESAEKIIAELLTMVPGKVVAYGYESLRLYSILWFPSDSDQRRIADIVRSLDQMNAVMLFQVRLPNRRIVRIVRGVEPAVRLRLESALRRHSDKEKAS